MVSPDSVRTDAIALSLIDWVGKIEEGFLRHFALLFHRLLLVIFFGLLSRICGSMEVLEVGLVYDTARFPSLDRCENHKIF